MGGMRETFLNPLLNKLSKQINVGKLGNTNLPKHIAEYAAEYIRAKRSSSYLDLAGIDDAIQSFLKMLGVDYRTKNAGQTIMSLWYSGALGGIPGMPIARPYASLRNFFQLEVTLAPYLGHRWLLEGIKRVGNPFASKAAQATWQNARKLGIIKGDWEFIDFNNTTNWIEQLAHNSLRGYKWTDDLTRVIAYEGGRARMNYYYKLCKQGKITLEGLYKKSGVKSLPGSLERIEVMKAVNQGDVERAAYLYGKHLEENNMFIMGRGEAAQILRKSGVHKFFGMFGSFPTQYITWMGRLAANPDPGVWARAALIHSALLGLGAQFGWGTASWVLFGPAKFTGGPAMSALSSVSKLVTSNNPYDQRRAKNQLYRVALLLAPGYLQGKDFYEVMQSNNLEEALQILLLGMKTGQGRKI